MALLNRGLLFAGLSLLSSCGSSGAPERPAGQLMGGAGAPDASSAVPGGAAPRGTSDATGSNGNGADAGSAPPYQISSRALVQWKRAAAFEADLMGALQLSRDQLCVELGGKNCIRDVHLVPMGGNEPYESGLMKPSAEPLATTSSVVDRVLLSACSARAKLDAAGPARVFTALHFDGPLPPAGDPAIVTTVRDLYRLLLARDPTPHELELVAELAESAEDGPLSTRDFAALSCFSIGSTIEFLFF